MDLPDNYVLIEDDFYVLKRGDKFTRSDDCSMETVSSYAGYTVKYLKEILDYKEQELEKKEIILRKMS